MRRCLAKPSKGRLPIPKLLLFWSALRAVGRWTPVLAWMGLIYYLSSRSSYAGSDVLVGSSIVVHLIEYGVLAGLLYWALLLHLARSEAIILGSFFAACVYGGLDEYHQLLVPGRTASWFDLAVDGAGAALGLLLAAAWRHVRRPRDSKSKIC